jgi:4-hydroxybenzoate polyprenyltransferase
VRHLRAFVDASHAAPTLAVTLTMTAFAWSIGWRGWPLVTVAAALLVGQLSVGWSNDAFDSATDRQADRRSKPSVRGDVTARALWTAAAAALAASCVLSWLAAGWVGGSFHVLALLAAWTYNVVLSRTAWSWLPYAVAFGAVPPFLYIGLDGHMGPWWTTVVFAIIAVSAHVANALPDLESDRAVGLDGLVIRLGVRRSTYLCWMLLGIGTSMLVIVTLTSGGASWTSVILVGAYPAAVLYGRFSTRRSAMFLALLVVVVVDVVALIASPAL